MGVKSFSDEDIARLKAMAERPSYKDAVANVIASTNAMTPQELAEFEREHGVRR